MDLPIIALVGKPNVGKSTLFNRLSHTRDALVSDFSGLTRDRKYATIHLDDQTPCQLVDTGGLTGQKNLVDEGINSQVNQALNEASLILFLVSARDEISLLDQNIAQRLRRLKKPIILVCNKSESNKNTNYQFYELGLGDPLSVSAEHGLGIDDLLLQSLEKIQNNSAVIKPNNEQNFEGEQGTMVAILGRPNVGKSTLTNRLLGEDRVLTLDLPGTTRDSIYIPFERDNKPYTFVDTAGIRRKRSVKEKIETFSIVKAIEAIEKSHVVLLILDAHTGITDQDASLLGLIMERDTALVLVVNKWDGIDHYQRQEIQRLLEVKLAFVSYSNIHYISALHGSGVGLLYESIDKACDHATRQFPTSYLNNILTKASKGHQPPLVQGRRIRLKFMNQTSNNPLTFVIHGNQVELIADGYKRYLTNFFRSELKIDNTPIVFNFKNSQNPYKDKKNSLNQRQLQKKRRLMKFVKKK